MGDGGTTDGGACLYYKLTTEPKGSGELKMTVFLLVKRITLSLYSHTIVFSSDIYVLIINECDVKSSIKTSSLRFWD